MILSRRKPAAGILWLIAIFACSAITGCGSGSNDVVAHSEYLKISWQAFQQHYLDSQGFVLDQRREGGQVTSEGQGYALLRALWMGDQKTFHRVHVWTEENLKRRDGLYSWLWEPKAGGRLVDPNSASDADQEIALALILASKVFATPAYLERGRNLLQSIRTYAGIELANEEWFPSAGNWAVSEGIINLSYFLPYAYPYFDRVDPSGHWMQVLQTGYRLIGQALEPSGVVLVSDFLRLRPDGSLSFLPQEHPLSSDFSFDSMRLFWRVAVDCRMHERLRACGDPLQIDWVIGELSRTGRVATRYQVSGEPVTDQESLSFYGSLLPALRIARPELARALLSEKLTAANLRKLVSSDDRYYDDNWVWFGLAADSGLLYQRTPPVEEFYESEGKFPSR